MKRIIIRVLGVLLFIISVLLICYPFISNYIKENAQKSEIVAYDDSVEKIEEDEKDRLFQEALDYNKTFLTQVVITDPFAPNYVQPKDYDYEKILNVENGVMGYIKIPFIDVDLPIFHGASDEVLKEGVGHLQNTSLPVGGKGSHSVLTGHTGLSSARLFSDLNQLKKGDKFYIYVLDEVLAYEVDNISVVLPNDTTTLQVSHDEDYVTLITCTPYGINSHRLLVRGTRIPYDPEEVVKESEIKVDSTWMREYRKALIAGAIIFIFIIIIFFLLRFIIRKVRKIRKKTISADDMKQKKIE